MRQLGIRQRIEPLTLFSSLMRYRGKLVLFAFGILGCFIMSMGENGVLLILSLTVCILAGYLILRQAGGFIITPAILFFLFFIVFTYVGGLGLFFDNGAGVSYGGGDRNYTFYYAIHGGILAIVLGLVSATIAFGFSPRKELLRFRQVPWRHMHNQPSDTAVIALIGAVAIIISALYVYSRGTLPLIKVLLAQGGVDVYELATTARAEFSRHGRGAGSYAYQGYFQQFYIIVLPLVTLYVGSCYLYYRKFVLRVLWATLGIISAFFLALSLQRWPLMFFIVMNYVLYVSYLGRIRTVHTVVFAGIALALFGFLTYIRGYENVAVVVYWVQNRIFITNVDVLYSIFEMFPEHFSFFGGKAVLGDLKAVLPGPDVAFTRWLYDALYQVYGSGSAPTIFWGELYADFGLPGVFIGSLAAGFIMQSVYITMIRGEKDLLRMILYVVLTMASAELALTNPVTVIFQFGVVTVFLMVVILKVMRWPLQASVIDLKRESGMRLGLS